MYLKPGDLVVCISNEPNPSYQPNPWMLERLETGGYYRVTNYFAGPPMCGLTLAGVDHAPGHGWQAWRFRKVVAADQAFSDTLRMKCLEPSFRSEQ